MIKECLAHKRMRAMHSSWNRKRAQTYNFHTKFAEILCARVSNMTRTRNSLNFWLCRSRSLPWIECFNQKNYPKLLKVWVCWVHLSHTFRQHCLRMSWGRCLPGQTQRSLPFSSASRTWVQLWINRQIRHPRVGMKSELESRTWWDVLAFPALGRLRQEDRRSWIQRQNT